MIKNLYVFPYNPASASAAALAKELGVVRIKRENSRFKGSLAKTVINWGCRALPEEITKCKVLNSANAIENCSDKLKFFTSLEQQAKARFVPFTTNIEEAKKWIEEGSTVFCRTILNGHSGQGIVEASTVEELVDAPLYTKYIPKKDEYRVHIFQGEVLVVQRKALREGGNAIGGINWKVRNVANGFIFARNEDQPVPEDVVSQAKNAFASIEGLDFCSVDVIWNKYRNEAYVLEINTASGLTGSTVKDYAEAFKKVVNA